MLTDGQYKRGLIDAAPVLRLLGQELAEEETKTARLSLADAHRVRRWESSGAARFALVDRLFCRLGMVAAFFEDEELAGEYARANVNHGDPRMKRCEREGCKTQFVQSRHTPASQPKRFCSHSCQSAAAKKVKTRRRGPGRSLEGLRCKNGHRRTPSNTHNRADGRGLDCLDCAREGQARTRRARGVKPRKCGICGGFGHNAATCHRANAPLVA